MRSFALSLVLPNINFKGYGPIGTPYRAEYSAPRSGPGRCSTHQTGALTGIEVRPMHSQPPNTAAGEHFADAERLLAALPLVKRRAARPGRARPRHPRSCRGRSRRDRRRPGERREATRERSATRLTANEPSVPTVSDHAQGAQRSHGAKVRRSSSGLQHLRLRSENDQGIRRLDPNTRALDGERWPAVFPGLAANH